MAPTSTSAAENNLNDKEFTSDGHTQPITRSRRRLTKPVNAAKASPATGIGSPQSVNIERSIAPVDSTAQSWLDAQCAMIAGVSRGIVLKRSRQSSDEDTAQPVAWWPKNATDLSEQLLTAAIEAAQSQSVVIYARQSDDVSEQLVCIVAAPLLIHHTEDVVVALALPGAIRHQRQALVQLLQWGATWYTLMCQQSRQALPKDRLVNVVEMLASSLEHTAFDAAATTAVTELAARLSCTRVSLGLLRGRHIEVCAISNSARVDTRSNLVRDIGSAMDEAVDQNATVAFPLLSAGLPHIAFAQEVLVRRNEGGSVCTTPLYDGSRTIGALTLERDDDGGFDPSTVEICEVFGALLGPVIALKHDKERWVGYKVLDAVRDFGARLCGRQHVMMKLYAFALVALVMFLSVATGDYRVTAKATLEGSVRRVITAPRNGFVATAELRAGDIVQAGQLLATLDDRELRLERVKLDSQREQHNKEHRAAVTTHDRSKAAIATAQMAQIVAQIDLIDEQMRRTQLTAPLSGIVVSGDLSQSLGSPVEHGQVLFEVAPLDSYRVMLEIDERDIGDIATQQRGELTLTGLPNTPLVFTVTRIVPISTARDGRNFFEVEATLDNNVTSIRPGMEGIGKINVDQRKLFWVWTHAMFDWLRLSLWTWVS